MTIKLLKMVEKRRNSKYFSSQKDIKSEGSFLKRRKLKQENQKHLHIYVLKYNDMSQTHVKNDRKQIL